MSRSSSTIVKRTDLTQRAWSSNTLLAGILIAGALLRLIVLISHRHNPFFYPEILDPAHYHAWALQMLNGQWVQDTAFYGLPLYPLWLAAFYKLFQQNLWAVKIAQSLLGLVNVLLVYHLTNVFFNQKTVALIAAFLAAFYGPYVFHELLFIPEAIGIVLYTLAFILFLKFWERPSSSKAAACGIAAALAGYTKPGAFLFAIIFVTVYLCAYKEPFIHRLRHAAIALATLLLLIAPSTLHNWKAANDFVPLTWHGGLNFYIGNHPGANGGYKTPPGIRSNIPGQIADSRMIAEESLGRPLNPSEISDFWFKKGWDAITAAPWDTLRLWFQKSLLFINHLEVTDVDSLEFSSTFSPPLRFAFINFLIIFALAVPGFVWGFSQIARYRLGLWILWVFVYTLGVVAFFSNARYRLPIISALLPFAAFALYAMTRAIFQKKFRMLLGGAAMIGIAAYMSGLHLMEANLATQFTNVGNIYMSRGEHSKALNWYDQAIRQNSHYAKAHQDAGTAHQLMGNHAAAEKSFLRAIEEDPQNPYPYNNLGLLYDSKGSVAEAQKLFEKALALQPNMPEAHNNLGMVLAKQQSWTRAESHFLKAIKLNPGYARALTNIGLVRYQQGDQLGARRYWQRALEADPRFTDAKKALDALKQNQKGW